MAKATKRKAPGKAKKKAPGGRRKAQPTQDETVEQSTGVQLLLGNMPSDRDALHRYETLMRLLAQQRSASGKVGDYKKKMREEGFDVEAFMATMTYEKMDPMDLASRFKEMARLIRERGLPIQIGLFETKYRSVEEQAEAFGYNDGQAGRSFNVSHYPEGAPGYEDYARGWNRGQAELVKGGAPAAGDNDEDDE